MELIFKGYEILNFLKICTFLKNGAIQVWNAAQQVPYAFHGNEWVGYDNIKSFHIKVRLVPWMFWALILSPRKQSDSHCYFSLNQAQWLKRNNYGGAMIWTIDMDDYTGSFCGQGTFPLTSILKKTLKVHSASKLL
jgi:GH18 family chitinase